MSQFQFGNFEILKIWTPITLLKIVHNLNVDFLIFGTSPLTPLGFFPLFSNKYINLKMCTFGTKFPNIDNWNYISKFRIWYLEMDVHFQKSIFGILVPNGPLIEVLPMI